MLSSLICRWSISRIGKETNTILRVAIKRLKRSHTINLFLEMILITLILANISLGVLMNSECYLKELLKGRIVRELYQKELS